MPVQAVGRLLTIWHEGLIAQVTSCPADLRIERWMYVEYPGLRDHQERSLARQLTEYAQVLSPEVRDITPPKIYRATTTMNAAFACYMSLLLENEGLTRPYHRMPGYAQGRAMARVSWTSKDRGYAGDMQTADRWATLFAIVDWFEWRPLKECS